MQKPNRDLERFGLQRLRSLVVVLDLVREGPASVSACTDDI